VRAFLKAEKYSARVGAPMASLSTMCGGSESGWKQRSRAASTSLCSGGGLGSTMSESFWSELVCPADYISEKAAERPRTPSNMIIIYNNNMSEKVRVAGCRL
jgi:hypothetical protein